MRVFEPGINQYQDAQDSMLQYTMTPLYGHDISDIFKVCVISPVNVL